MNQDTVKSGARQKQSHQCAQLRIQLSGLLWGSAPCSTHSVSSPLWLAPQLLLVLVVVHGTAISKTLCNWAALSSPRASHRIPHGAKP